MIPPSKGLDVIECITQHFDNDTYTQDDAVAIREDMKSIFIALKKSYDRSPTYHKGIDDGGDELAWCMVCGSFVVMDIKTIAEERRAYTCFGCKIDTLPNPVVLKKRAENKIMRSPRINPQLFHLSDAGRVYCSDMYSQSEDKFHSVASTQNDEDGDPAFRRCGCLRIECVRNTYWSKHKCGYCSTSMCYECVPPTDTAGTYYMSLIIIYY